MLTVGIHSENILRTKPIVSEPLPEEMSIEAKSIKLEWRNSI